MNDEPLTEEALKWLEEQARGLLPGPTAPRYAIQDLGLHMLRLIAEVRRLRADDWLDRAAKEIVEVVGCDHGTPSHQEGIAMARSILRQHRDKP